MKIRFTHWLENREEQYFRAAQVANTHHYAAMSAKIEPIDIENSNLQDVANYLQNLHLIPDSISPLRFAAQVKAAIRGQFNPSQDIK